MDRRNGSSKELVMLTGEDFVKIKRKINYDIALLNKGFFFYMLFELEIILIVFLCTLFIYSHPQTVLLYDNSSVWLDM